jgi:hypothetical protein
MARSYRDWLVTIPFLAPVALSLLCVAAILGWAAVGYLSAPPLPDDHQRLIADLRAGAYTRLEDITPRPGRSLPANEVHRPAKGASYYLYYELPEHRRLVIALDTNLRLVDYDTRDAD